MHRHSLRTNASIPQILKIFNTISISNSSNSPQQFTTLVVISTFTANLIIAFLTLAHNLISRGQDIYAYSMIIEVGQFLALIGRATHAGVIIISGRCAALALKHAEKQAKLIDEQWGKKMR
ncbi:hypothetical protein M378DRAFT_336365 [Amanita muscaria Koide BX008]|uniref:Uncharacterized protein n=1 Tax=Amanita muscaria (strain Koide BX008) TaxID=946122 RepID=A0A0C2WNG9_AMAMK|nr:hypothetical protein M378DRAFT_336365 [Amanita muscaria Koide BX008]